MQHIINKLNHVVMDENSKAVENKDINLGMECEVIGRNQLIKSESSLKSNSTVMSDIPPTVKESDTDSGNRLGTNSIDVKALQRKRWELLTQTLIPLPQLRDIAEDIVKEKINSSTISEISSEYFPSLLSDLFPIMERDIERLYGESLSFPNTSEFFHIIHRLDMPINERSMISADDNATAWDEEFQATKNGIDCPTSDVNFMILALSANKTADNTIAKEVAELYDHIKILLTNRTLTSDSYKHGKFLERVFYDMTRVRLLAHEAYPETQVSVDKYGVSSTITIDGYDVPSTCCFIRPSACKWIEDPLPSLRQNNYQFFQLLQANITEGGSYIFQADEFDCFDMLLVVTLGNDNKPFIIFYECKSCSPLFDSYRSLKYMQRLKELKQAKVVHKNIKIMKIYASESSYKSSPVIEALFEGRYAYVYATTFPDPVPGDIERPMNTDIVNIDFMRRYLSFAYPIYESARGLMSFCEDSHQLK